MQKFLIQSCYASVWRKPANTDQANAYKKNVTANDKRRVLLIVVFVALFIFQPNPRLKTVYVGSTNKKQPIPNIDKHEIVSQSRKDNHAIQFNFKRF